MTALPKADKIWDYYDWTCNYYGDSDRYADENVERDAEINGFGDAEPSNVVI